MSLGMMIFGGVISGLAWFVSTVFFVEAIFA